MQKDLKSQLKPRIKFIRWRLLGIFFVFFLAYAAIGARAVHLHLGNNERLQKLAKNQYKRRLVIQPKRGSLLDRNGETLALDIQVKSLYAVPYKVKDPEALAKNLAKILSLPAKKILKKLKETNRKFVWIQRRLNFEQAKALEELQDPALGLLPEYKRFYPNGRLASNLLGAVGLDALALSGLEFSLDDLLKSESPPLLVEKDARGRTYGAHALASRENPKQVKLSIDKNLQYLAESQLQKAVKKAQAKKGVALILEVSTGEILAMASVPSFNPNEYSKHPVEHWKNLNLSYSFEPGSTFKAITAAAALEAGVIKEGETIDCQKGKMRFNKTVINDHHGYEHLTLNEIIKYSSNIGSFKLAQRLGKERFLGFVKAFGFGQKTSIKAPGENPGLVASLKQIRDLQLGTMGFGQGISVTPLQLALAYGALANEGNLMKPLLVKEIQDSHGKTLKTFEPKIKNQTVSPEVAQKVLAALSEVVKKGGTGTQAALQAYTVAGKTGTAQKVIEGKKGYAKGRYIASFVGLAPVENPKLVIAVSIDEPKGSYYGGVVAAPTFKQIMEQALTYLQVPNSLPKEVLRVAAVEPKKTKAPRKKTRETAKAKNLKTFDKESTPGTKHLASLPADRTLKANQVPDLRGLSVREALRKASLSQINLLLSGHGTCYEQSPPPGTILREGRDVKLKCKPSL